MIFVVEDMLFVTIFTVTAILFVLATAPLLICTLQINTIGMYCILHYFGLLFTSCQYFWVGQIIV